MSDLIKRLRDSEQCSSYTYYPCKGLRNADEAADEIERLTAEIERLQATLAEAEQTIEHFKSGDREQDLMKMLADDKLEIERLQARCRELEGAVADGVEIVADEIKRANDEIERANKAEARVKELEAKCMASPSEAEWMLRAQQSETKCFEMTGVLETLSEYNTDCMDDITDVEIIMRMMELAKQALYNLPQSVTKLMAVVEAAQELASCPEATDMRDEIEQVKKAVRALKETKP